MLNKYITAQRQSINGLDQLAQEWDSYHENPLPLFFKKVMAKDILTFIRRQGVTIVKTTIGYMEVSGYIKNGDKYIYFSTGDVRYSNDWFNRVLVREASSLTDYRGGRNQFIRMDQFFNIKNMRF